MKNLLRYGFLILLLGLLHTMTAHALQVTQRSDVQATQCCYVPQAQAQQESAQLFHFFYSHALSGTVVVNHLSVEIKSLIRSFDLFDITKDTLPVLAYLGKLHAHSLHRDPVRYYIFTLEKIVI